VASV
jgi:hypothetical protein